ncbi:MAG: M3 family oligoendopeptidase [Bdellovibrio sp.]
METSMAALPAWNNTTEYKGIGASDFNDDLAQVQTLWEQLQIVNLEMAKWFDGADVGGARPQLILGLQKISQLGENAGVLLSNLSTFVNCELSVDAKNAAALKAMSQIQKIAADLSTVMKPFEVYLTRADESVLKDYLSSEHTKSETFLWSEKRKMKDLMLSTSEEMTLAQFKQFGLHSWGDMYDQISGSLKVELPSQSKAVGVAEATGLLRGNDESLRKEAWTGIQDAWKKFEEPCAAVLNNLSGFRLEEYRKRSHTRPLDFLEFPLMESKIERDTLEAMMNAVQSRITVPRRALKSMAKCLGKTRLDPWDIMAPSPKAAKGANYPFEKGIALIEQAFAGVDSSMGEFVRMMVKNNWIEARVLPNKKPGAYCTGFMKSRSPRVFQTYMGSYQEMSTLAHELGHAYHSWVMRDMPFAHLEYPMTLAETASIFAETLLADHLNEAGDAETRFGIAWAHAADAAALLVNIPARYEFEKSFYEARKNGALSAGELSDLTEKAWLKWYGEELSQTERQYWMTKLHFSISGVSFYNYPYTFGYLFSLGIYAKRAELGAGFSKAYVEILRDTGRMTAEDLIQKHLGQDIRKPDFWLGSIGIVEKKVSDFEKLLSSN